MNLEKILDYQNLHVMARYQRDYPNNKIVPNEALKHLGQYLWLANKHQQDYEINKDNKDLHFECGIYSEMQEIDDMWHTFLLFTKDYMEYCDTYFGKFMHHMPTISINSSSQQQKEIEFTRFLSYAYDHLGENIVKVWFAEYF